MKIVRTFEPQELFYGSFSRKEMLSMAIKSYESGSPFISDDATFWEFDKYIESKYHGNISKDELIMESNNLLYHFYYDAENDKYWISEELYKKALNSRNKKDAHK